MLAAHDESPHPSDSHTTEKAAAAVEAPLAPRRYSGRKAAAPVPPARIRPDVMCSDRQRGPAMWATLTTGAGWERAWRT